MSTPAPLPRYLVTRELPHPATELLERTGAVTVLDTPPSAVELRRLVTSNDFDVVLAQLTDIFDPDLLSDARIKGVSNYAVGVDNIDIPAATRHGVKVTNTPGVLTEPTADIAMLLMLATARRCVESDRFLREGKFTGWEPDLLLGADVSGRTLGLVGFGRIAQAVARRALGFGMTVTHARLRPSTSKPAGNYPGLEAVAEVPFDELLETSDFVSLHVPLAPGTRHLIAAPQLAAMRSTAILINTARGAVVDEHALVAALRDGVIAGAGLDVFEREPTLATGLADLPNTTLLPHLGSATTRVRSEMARICAVNAIAIATGDVPPHPVN